MGELRVGDHRQDVGKESSNELDIMIITPEHAVYAMLATHTVHMGHPSADGKRSKA